MNTPNHLKPYETAARIYCARMGVDPDATRKEAHPIIRGATVEVVMWHQAAEQLADLSMMLSSLKAAHQAGKETLQ